MLRSLERWDSLFVVILMRRNEKHLNPFLRTRKKSTNAPSIIFRIDLWKEKNICVLRGRIFKVASTFRLKVPLGAKCTLVIAELKIDSFKNFFWLLVTLMPKAKEWPSVQKREPSQHVKVITKNVDDEKTMY